MRLAHAVARQTRRSLATRTNRAWDGRLATSRWAKRRAPESPEPRVVAGAGGAAASARPTTLERLGGYVDLSQLQTTSAREVLRAVGEQSRQQWRGVAGALAVLITGVWFFRREVKDEVAGAAAELGALTMSHESVRAEVQSIGKFLAHELLHDPRVAAAATTLVADVIRRQSTRDAFLDLVVWTVDRDATKAAVRDALRGVSADLCRDDLVQARVSELLASALRREDTRAAAVDLAAMLLRDETCEAATRDLASAVLARDDVRRAGEDAMVDAALGALEDAELRRTARAAAQTTLADRHVQKSAGDALWQAYKYSLGLGPRRKVTEAEEAPAPRRRRAAAAAEPAAGPDDDAGDAPAAPAPPSSPSAPPPPAAGVAVAR